MRWPGRGSALPAELATELATAVGGRPRVLRWAEGDKGVVVALPDRLAVRREDWWLIGWHEIDGGGWSAPDELLEWQCADGRRGRMRLRDPGRLPEVFRERVQATIVVRRDLTDPDTGARFTVSARRRLDRTDAPLQWRTALARGVRADHPGLAEAMEAALQRLRNEYDITPQGC